MTVLRLHASCVALESCGVLLMGEPGLGKSDLALRLIDRGAKLVADDQVELTRKGENVLANTPESIAGLLELRGIGIFKLRPKKNVPVKLVVHLSHREWIERLPYPEPYICMELEIPGIRLCAFEQSAVIKVEMAVAALQDGSMTVGALKE